MVRKLADSCFCEGIVDVIRNIIVLFIDFQFCSIGLLNSSRILVITNNRFMHLIGPGNLAHAILLRRRMLLLLNVGSNKSILSEDDFLRLNLIVERKGHQINLLWYDFFPGEGNFSVLLEFHSRNGLQLAMDVLNSIDKEKLLLLEAILEYLLGKQLLILIFNPFLKRLRPTLNNLLNPQLFLCLLHINLHHSLLTLLEISSTTSISSSSPKYLPAVCTKFSLPPIILPSNV